MKKVLKSLILKLMGFGTAFFRIFPPEISSNMALKSLNTLNTLGITLIQEKKGNDEIELFGINFKNKLGLAAGLDKNGDYINALGNLGFRFIELGTVTPRPQRGNKKPRLFRDQKNLSLLNRMGFNNKGVEYLVSKVKKVETHSHYKIAISIGKNFDTPNEKAIDDYLFCLEKAYPVTNFITVNISSPNTKDLRSLQSPRELPNFLSALKEKQHSLTKEFGYKPLLVKISPDENQIEHLKEISNILVSLEIDGIIATNTSVDHKHKKGEGGISGALLFKKSTKVLSIMRENLGKDFPIIASGGVTDVKTYWKKINSGADLVQIYTGMIYRGPQIIEEILNSIEQ